MARNFSVCVAIFVIVATSLGSVRSQDDDTPVTLTPEQYICHLACAQKRTRDAFIADPDDCLVYYHCQRNDDGSYTSAKHRCAANQHWSQRLLQCVPGPCQDPCLDPVVSKQGFYVIPGENCRAFYQCANGISYQMCCPDGTSFDENVNYCTENENCTGFSCPAGPIPNPPEPKPPVRYNDTACVSEFNTTLAVDPSNEAGYLEWDEAAETWIQRLCPIGSIFSGLKECGCHNRSADFPLGDGKTPQCFLYLNFDTTPSGKFVDGSIFLNDIDQDCVAVSTTDFAKGAGAASFNGTCHLEVPAFQSKDFGHSMSICFWAKTDRSGGIYNQMSFDDGTGTLLAGTRIWLGNKGDEPKITWDFQDPVDSAFYSNALPTSLNKWVHYCFVKQNSEWRIYVDNVLASSTPLPTDFRLMMPQCPLSVGFDDLKGSLTGLIDELLVCDTPFNGYLVDAVYTNQLDKLRAINLLP